jgi:glycerophosphoryl diester phosphodiesterase
LEGLGPIAGLGLAAIRAVRLSNSEGIPSLGEALEAIFDAARGKANPEVWIELKALPESADQTLLAVIDRSAIPESCGVHSFDHRIVARIGRKRPALRRGILSASYPVDPVAPMRAAGARVLWQEWHLIDAALVTMVHQAGGQIVAWTVNEVETARRLARIGVDALCGNWPERLRAE